MKIQLLIPDENADELTDYLLDYLERSAAYYTLNVKSNDNSWELRRPERQSEFTD